MRLKRAKADLSGVAITPDGKEVITVAPVDRDIEILDVATGKSLARLTPPEQPPGSPTGVCVSQNGERMLVTGCNHGRDTVWNLKTRK